MRRINFSSESITFQNPVFFSELSKTVGELRSARTYRDVEDHVAVNSLSKIIKHHTGLNINIVITEPGHGPAIDIPKVDRNHILLNNVGDYVSISTSNKLFSENDNVLVGNVDINKNTVTGVFTQVDLNMYFPYVFFVGTDFTDEEIAAIMLHEVGHGFTCFEYINRSVSTVQVIAGIARELNANDSEENRTLVLLKSSKALHLSDEDVKQLAKTKSKNSTEFISAVVISKHMERSRGELGINIYDKASWEQLADEYAARCGAGVHLATALNKLIGESGNKAYRGFFKFNFIEALKVVMAIAVLMFTSIGMITLAWRVILPILLMLLARDADEVTYDTPEARIKRIRNQIIQAMKDKTLSKEDSTRLNEDLELIDKSLEGVEDRRQLLGVLLDFVIPGYRRDRSIKKLCQDMEVLANNEMFAKANLFKSMT